MNNNENISISKLLAVLDIQDDESFIITDVEWIDDKKYLHIQKKLEPVYCPRCGSRMLSILVSLITLSFRILLNFI